MTEFTIVIPHRGDPLGLWATIQSCEEDLSHKNIPYNFIIVSNGEELSIDAKQAIRHLEHGGKLVKHLHFDEPLTPPVARQRGAALADGKYLAFFDNHCLVGRQYFERAQMDFETHNMDMLHSSTSFYRTGDGITYHYRLKLDYNFWAEGLRIPKHPYKPYKIAAAGHGGFIIRRDVWNEVGGYGPEDLFIGYGGEEMIFDLKMARYGKTNWLDPQVVHYHYSGHRSYDRHYTDDYYTNLFVSANVIGGRSWMERLCESFVTKTHIRIRPQKTFVELMEIAGERSAEYAAEVESRSVKTLDDCLTEFVQNEVAY